MNSAPRQNTNAGKGRRERQTLSYNARGGSAPRFAIALARFREYNPNYVPGFARLELSKKVLQAKDG